ncbi:hypothetical protein HH308_14445 [Gordonia sp. TBRC 11910]|uniref:Uncharacterized protein n=1 Tax=Gordonia asplenii TaxID=2725283 RepID=A0A848L012_9ACTN|nr:hypothetical protein [Gordonia asplenii]NMO02415.1 hypothetical protein [Gordonia asplenii]
MFTDEQSATRALGAAFHNKPEFALHWLRSIGINADVIRSVSIERQYEVPGPHGKKRKADVYLEVEDGSLEVVIVEAKVAASAAVGGDGVECKCPKWVVGRFGP